MAEKRSASAGILLAGLGGLAFLIENSQKPEEKGFRIVGAAVGAILAGMGAVATLLNPARPRWLDVFVLIANLLVGGASTVHLISLLRGGE